MKLSEIASISGKGGLFHIVAPTRSGVIVEALDETKRRMVASATSRVSVLHEISIYTTDAEGSVPLQDVFAKIKEEFGDDPGVGNKSSKEELRAFMKHILPNHEEERVYISDIKKLVSWYKILFARCPEVLDKPAEEDAGGEQAEGEA
ncbi:hypothetical protein FUAX_35840 [Fulvitalea axinellae]|uniref:DUF5606 domain-containing protein n=1 Tax=Fulvitalea axinellae TaxID=1182444 RepID=A0AAU9D0F6_9BACT|nr:hypothetical protein FUAX_35840 [Fulvitalea axinellae]